VKSLAVTRNILRRVVHDRRTLVLIALIPLFFVLLYGYSFSGKPRNMGVLIVNEDNGLASVRTAEVGRITLEVRLAEQFIRNLDREMFDVVLDFDADVSRARVGSDGVWAAVVFPQNFSHAVVNESLRAGGQRVVEYNGRTVRLLPPESVEGPVATLVIDDSNPVVTSALLLGFRDALARVLAGQQQAIVPEAVLQIEQVYGGEIRGLDYTAPGVIGFAMTLITIMLTVISIVRERTGGTLTRLLIAPIRPWQVTLGYTAAFAAIALFQVGELFLVSALLFGIRIAGSLGWIALVVVLYAIGLQGIATLLSTMARNEFQAMQFILFLLVPSLMISGVFWPLEAMPPGMRPLSLLSPLTYANTALRTIMLKGGGLSDVALELAVLAGFAALMLAFAIQSMRRQAYTA
jgi:ABC-2 type transport system permease protein